MKKLSTILSVLVVFGAVTLASNQASAKNMCNEVSHYKGLLDHLNKGLASKGAEGMAAALREIGVDPSEKEMKGGKVALKIMIQVQEGSLYTALSLAEAGCHTEQLAEKAKKLAEKLAAALTHHRHLVCKHWGHGHHRHYACRWRG